jgi:hypothetical protein
MTTIQINPVEDTIISYQQEGNIETNQNLENRFIFNLLLVVYSIVSVVFGVFGIFMTSQYIILERIDYLFYSLLSFICCLMFLYIVCAIKN